MKNQENKKEIKVYQSNDITEGRFDFSKNELIMLGFIFKAIWLDHKGEKEQNKTLFGDMYIKLECNYIREYFDIQIRDIVKALKSLTKKDLYILNNEKKYEKFFNIVLSVKHEYKKNSLTVLIDDEMIKYIVQLYEKFTTYDLLKIIEMHSKYSIRMYQICRQYYNLKSNCFKLSIDKINDMFMCNYGWRDIKRRILEPAVKELREMFDNPKMGPNKEDFYISYEPSSKYDVQYVTIYIHKRTPEKIDQGELYVFLADVLTGYLSDFKYKKHNTKLVNQWVQVFRDDPYARPYIERIAKICNSGSYKGKKIDNPQAYISQMLKKSIEQAKNQITLQMMLEKSTEI